MNSWLTGWLAGWYRRRLDDFYRDRSSLVILALTEGFSFSRVTRRDRSNRLVTYIHTSYSSGESKRHDVADPISDRRVERIFYCEISLYPGLWRRSEESLLVMRPYLLLHYIIMAGLLFAKVDLGPVDLHCSRSSMYVSTSSRTSRCSIFLAGRRTPTYPPLLSLSAQDSQQIPFVFSFSG